MRGAGPRSPMRSPRLVDGDDLTALVGAAGGAHAVRELGSAALGARHGLHGAHVRVLGTAGTGLHTAGFTLGNCHHVPLLNSATRLREPTASLHSCLWYHIRQSDCTRNLRCAATTHQRRALRPQPSGVPPRRPRTPRRRGRPRTPRRPPRQAPQAPWHDRPRWCRRQR